MKKILIGLDGSQAQPRVLVVALGLARKLSAEVILFRAVALPSELPAAALSVSPDSVAELLVGSAKRDLDALLRRIEPPLPARTRVDLGTPWRSLLAAAKAEHADLVVIGSHGYSGLDRLLGTTAAKVVNHADCSVLVVRPDGPLPV